MNGFYSLHESQRLCSIPTSIQSFLREKIKASDFLVADDKGVHRLVGLKYDLKTMNAPIVTCVCMRHEMPAAKRIAFELGKEIRYDSKVSALAFKYHAGEEIWESDYSPIAKLYSTFSFCPFLRLDAEFASGIQIHRNGVIYIKGHALSARPKLSDLSEILGEPDSKWLEQRFNRLKVSFWDDWGLYAFSRLCKGKYLVAIDLFVKEQNYCCPLKFPLASIAEISFCGKPIESAEPFSLEIRAGNFYTRIWTLDGNHEVVSDRSRKDEIVVLHFEFGRLDNGK